MAKKRRLKKWLFIGLPVIIIAVLVVINLGKSNGNATTVQADLVKVDDISEVVTASGRIEPQTKVDITAEVSAQIVKLFVSEGDYVTRGTMLLMLDTVQAQSDVAQARYSVDEITARAEAARTQRDKDKLEFERQERLFEKKLTSENDYTDAKFANDNSLANYNATLAQVKTLTARLDQAEDRLRKTKIVAPMDGTITYLSAEVGEIAQAQTSATQGKTLMTIADLSTFEVEVEVDETEIAKVTIGQPADIRVDAFRDTSFAGNVVEIGNSAVIQGQGTENYTTSFRVKVRFADTDASIRPGMSATVDITTATEKDATLIPYAALVSREFHPDSLDMPPTSEKSDGVYAADGADDSDMVDESLAGDTISDSAAVESPKSKERVKLTGVFVVKEGRAKFVEVPTGIADELNIVALSGVSPQDTVISGSFQTLRKLKNGDAVVIEQRSLDKMKEKQI